MKNLKYTMANIGLSLIAALAFINCSESDEVNLGPKPVADFKASINELEVEVGAIVTFTDVSTNEPSLFTWEVPGGNPTYSNQSSITVEFLAEGEQPVTLTARNNAGADKITKYVTVTPLEIPDLEGVVPAVKMRFENDLLNEGSAGGNGINGSSSYEPRSKYGGMGMKFSAISGQHVVLEDYTGVNGADARTVTCWVKTDATSVAGLVHWGASGTYSRNSFKMNKNGTIRFEFQGGGLNGTTSVNDNAWHHIAYSYDGQMVKLYVDGVLDASLENSNINTGVAGETPVYIGSQAGGALYKGMIDDVRIYGEALLIEQIQFLSTIH
ncbi:LamG-like jellyroll fold domain-containing protein [Carboxylicivirga sp. RSCT41]|uniref:LamG-like jellyroll fold domain-containing protein n=1 Tax=Carboxylicivirga agarovorans TaxID=3417570 RepID=UPI003D33FE5E